MSVKDVKAFFEKVEGDKGLQAKLKALAEKRKAQAEAGVVELVKMAAAAGLKFSAADLAEARREAAGQLSENELRAVAGGQIDSSCQRGLGIDSQAFLLCQRGLGAY